MRLLLIIFIPLFISNIVKAEKLTVYTYDSFVSEWGPGPIIEKIFEDKYNIDLEFIAVDGAATLLNKIILEGENSNADIARDLRILVRDMIVNGESNKEILNFVHEKYGDFILFKPPIKSYTFLLWACPFLLFIIFMSLFFRRKN